MTFSPEFLLSLSGYVLLAIRWMYNRARTAQASEQFIHSVATNHLPHIYDSLEKIAKHLGVDLGHTPNINFELEK